VLTPLTRDTKLAHEILTKEFSQEGVVQGGILSAFRRANRPG